MNCHISRVSVFGLLSSCLVALAACSPTAGDGSNAADIAAAPEPLRPVYRSAKQVSSDCGVQRTPGPVPGMAPVSGGKIKEMTDRMAGFLAVGANREAVETDDERVAPGYVVVEPVVVKESFVLNNDKEVVATFESDYFTQYTQFHADGNRTAAPQTHTDIFKSGGRNGCLEEYSAAGELLWRIRLNTENYIQHHDHFRLDNGNILAVVWERVSTDEVISQGRDPEAVAENGEFWYDGVIEINPYTQEIVWEWSERHHLIQDFDAGERNYGVIAEHPELIDINKYIRDPEDDSVSADWTHVNSIDYNAELDQIILSVHDLSEIWIIDHSTTPWESMRHRGGRQGKGGDLLYRWGNPANYDRGTAADRKLFVQHDAQWIRPGLEGAGNILVFNNGDGKVRPYTTIVEFTPEMNAGGSYVLNDGAAYGPEELAWEYNPEPPERFFSWFISGVQRLPNGNTFINQGAGAKLREVTPDGEIVWEFFYAGVHEAPYMIFRAYKYPPDHPAILRLLSTSL